MEEKKIKIEIKNRYTGSILFEYEKVNNTAKDTVVEAVKNGVNLGGANLGDADLRGAYLGGANLRGANLRGAKDVPYIPMTCPSDGEFVGWKKVKDTFDFFLVKLMIQSDSRRSSSTGRKCRCDKALVLGVYQINEKDEIIKEHDVCVNHAYGHNTEYRKGEIVEADSWDDNRWNECSHGIHFFINKQDALNYKV